MDSLWWNFLSPLLILLSDCFITIVFGKPLCSDYLCLLARWASDFLDLKIWLGLPTRPTNYLSLLLSSRVASDYSFEQGTAIRASVTHVHGAFGSRKRPETVASDHLLHFYQASIVVVVVVVVALLKLHDHHLRQLVGFVIVGRWFRRLQNW